MSFEKPDDIMEKLKEIETRAKEANKENPPKTFETEDGYSVYVFFREDSRTLNLNENGLESTFLIDDDGIRFMELRGPDDEHVTNREIINRHKDKAEQLLNDLQLEKIDQITEQQELDL